MPGYHAIRAPVVEDASEPAADGPAEASVATG
jgi:hypothetical protein